MDQTRHGARRADETEIAATRAKSKGIHTPRSRRRASVSVIGWAVREYDIFYPVTLRVIGSERYGSFDCWKIRVVAGTQRRTEWVRKSDGIALRSLDDAPPGPRGRREFVLLNP